MTFSNARATAHPPSPLAKTARRLGLGLAVLAGAAQVAPASAAVVSASSVAFGETLTLVTAPPLVAPVTLTSPQQPVASGTAPAPYNVTQTAIPLAVGTVLSTGTLTSTAASNVDGLAGARSVNASSTVQNLAISILTVLGLTADSVFSSADISGSPGALTPLATTTIANLRLAGALVPTGVIAPNTVILNAAGVKVTLNEQTLTGAGTNDQALLVNAIDISIANATQPVVGSLTGETQLLNGNILIGQSRASLTAVADNTPVPEPASMLLLATGLFGIALCRTRRM